MTIEKMYKTSVGYFSTLEEANKKKNRPMKNSSLGQGDIDFERDRETPQEVYVLCFEDKRFILNEIVYGLVKDSCDCAWHQK